MWMFKQMFSTRATKNGKVPLRMHSLYRVITSRSKGILQNIFQAHHFEFFSLQKLSTRKVAEIRLMSRLVSAVGLVRKFLSKACFPKIHILKMFCVSLQLCIYTYICVLIVHFEGIYFQAKNGSF